MFKNSVVYIQPLVFKPFFPSGNVTKQQPTKYSASTSAGLQPRSQFEYENISGSQLSKSQPAPTRPNAFNPDRFVLNFSFLLFQILFIYFFLNEEVFFVRIIIIFKLF